MHPWRYRGVRDCRCQRPSHPGQPFLQTRRTPLPKRSHNTERGRPKTFSNKHKRVRRTLPYTCRGNTQTVAGLRTLMCVVQVAFFVRCSSDEWLKVKQKDNQLKLIPRYRPTCPKPASSPHLHPHHNASHFHFLTGDKNGRDSQGGVSTEEGCCRDTERRHHRPLREGHAQARGQPHRARRSGRAEEGCHRRPHGARQQRPLRIYDFWRFLPHAWACRQGGGGGKQAKVLLRSI